MLNSYNFISTNTNISSISSDIPKTTIPKTSSTVFANILNTTLLNTSSTVQSVTTATTAKTNTTSIIATPILNQNIEGIGAKTPTPNFSGILNQTLTTSIVSINPTITEPTISVSPSVNTSGTFGIYNPTIQGINTGVLPKLTGSLAVYNPIIKSDTLTTINLVDISKNYPPKEITETKIEVKPSLQDLKSESNVNNQSVQVKGAQVTVTQYTPAMKAVKTEGNIAQNVAQTETTKAEKTNTTQQTNKQIQEPKKQEENPKIRLYTEFVAKEEATGNKVNIRDIVLKAFVNRINVNNKDKTPENIKNIDEVTNLTKAADNKKLNQMKDFLVNLANKGKDVKTSDDNTIVSFAAATKLKEQESKETLANKTKKEELHSIKEVESKRYEEEAGRNREGM